MAKQVKATDVVEKDLFENTIESATKLLSLTKEVKSEFTDILKASKDIISANPFENSKDFKAYSIEISKIKTVIEEVNKLTEQEQKLSAQIALSKTEEAKRVALLNVQKNEANKNLKEEVKLASTATGAYEKESITLNRLRRSYKDLAVAGKQNTDEAKKLLKEITALDIKLKAVDDTVGQHQRHVGDYARALGELFPLFGQAAAGVETFGRSLFKLLKNPVVLLIAGIAAALYGLVSLLKTTDDGATSFAGTMKGLSNVMDVLRIRLVGVVTGTLSLTEAFSGLGDALSGAFKAGVEYEKQLDRLEDAETAYISQRAANANKVAKLDYIARDTTKNILDRIDALQELIKIELDQAAEEENIANQRYAAEIKLLATTKNIESEKLKSFIESAESRSELQDKYNFTDEEIKGLEESFAKTKEFNTKFYEETKKANSRLQALRKEEVYQRLQVYDIERQIEIDQIKNQSQISERNLQQLEKLNEKTLDQISKENNIMDVILDSRKDKLRKQALELTKSGLEEQRKLAQELLERQAEDETIKAINSIENEEARAKEIERIRKKLADDIDNLNNTTAIKEKELLEKTTKENRKILADRVKVFEEFTDKIVDKINERKDAEISAAEEEEEKRKSAIDRQEARATQGLDNTLAYEKEKLAQAELEKKQLEEQREKRLKRQAYYKALISALENEKDPPLVAVGKAVAALAVSDAIVGAFKDGVENLDGKGNGTSDDNLAWLSKGESVIRAKSTAEAPGLATAWNKEGLVGAERWFLEYMKPYLSGSGISTPSNVEVVSELKQIKREVTNGGSNIHWDSRDQMIERKIKRGMKTVITHVNSRGRIC